MTPEPKDPELFWKVAKVAAATGRCSRRKAQELITDGFVLFDGVLITNLAERVSKDAKVEFNLEQSKPLTVIYHKPLGILSCGPRKKNYAIAGESLEMDNLVCDLEDKELFCKQLSENIEENPLQCGGRLDVHSKGLLILSNDVRVLRRLLNDTSPIEKEYLVKTEEPLSPHQYAKLQKVNSIDGMPLKPFKILQLAEDFLKITLIEGKKHQIRKMLYKIGSQAIRIKRVRIGNIKLANLNTNEWRPLNDSELSFLLK